MGIAVPRPLSLPTEPAKAEAGRITPGVPPWLWMWTVLFLLNSPAMLTVWQSSLDQIALIRDSPVSGRLDFLLYPAVLLDFIPSAALLLGLAAGLIPTVRGGFVRRRYAIGEPPRDDKRLGPVIEEIETYLQTVAPGLTTMWSNRLDVHDPHVFPLNYRQSAVALNAKFLVGWRRDQEAAKAILLHEAGHYRRGDGKIIGLGSPFEAVVRYAFPAFLVLFIVPILILTIVSMITSSAELADGGIETQTLLQHMLGGMQLQLTAVLSAAIAYLFWFASQFVVPVAAIWAAEFGADRFAADSQGMTAGIQRIIASERPLPWPRRMLEGLAHPPAGLRRWMVERRISAALALPTLIVPIAYVLSPLLLQVWTGLGLHVAQSSLEEIGDAAVTNSLLYFYTMTRAWLLMAALLVLWPFIVRSWERVMTGEPGVSSRSNVFVYWACAVALVALGLFGIAAGRVLESAAALEVQNTVETADSSSAVVAPAPPVVGASRDAPAPLGTEVISGDLGLAVVEVAAGETAWDILREANMVNDEAAPGEEYVLALVRVRNAGDEPHEVNPFRFGLTASGNVIYSVSDQVPPEPWLFATVEPGGVIEGWVAMSVGQDESHRQLVYLGDPHEGMRVESWRFLALEEDAALAPGELALPWAE